VNHEPEATQAEPARPGAAEETIRRQQAQIDSQAARIVELEALDSERRALRRRLIEAETELAELPALRARVAELESLASSPAWRLWRRVSLPARRARAVWVPGFRSLAKRIVHELARLTRLSR
jgi:hypothetical protein